MTKPAAFRATYSDWHPRKTRSVVVISFEVPIEKADEAYQALGGMPLPGQEVWCAIARLNPGAEPVNLNPPSATAAGQHERIAHPPGVPHQTSRHEGGGTEANPAGTDPQSRPGGATKKSWDERSAGWQAGYLCNTKSFQKFLFERGDISVTDEHEAILYVRAHCGVASRREIDSKPAALDSWRMLTAEYDFWQRGQPF